MTHDEYLTRLDGFTDSSDDVAEVLLHTASCADCRRDGRSIERVLSRLDPGRRSLFEEAARLAATAAVVAVILLGVQSLTVGPDTPEGPTRQVPRYRIVGDTSGVVAYTPSGIVVGVAEPSKSRMKGVER